MAEPDLPEVGVYSARLQIIAACVLALIFILILCLAGGADWPVFWLASSLGLSGVLLSLAAFDLRAHILPDWLTLPLLFAGLAVSALTPLSLLWSGLGAIAGYGLIAGLRWLWLQRRGVEAIGLGDAKMVAAGGAWVGASGLPVVLMVASGAGLVAALLARNVLQGKALPFGVFLSLGVWVSWCFWTTPLAKLGG